MVSNGCSFQNRNRMRNLTCIVVTTDFSVPANAAVTRATLLARQHGAELHLLHVLSPWRCIPVRLSSLPQTAMPDSLPPAVSSMPQPDACLSVTTSLSASRSVSAARIPASENMPTMSPPIWWWRVSGAHRAPCAHRALSPSACGGRFLPAYPSCLHLGQTDGRRRAGARAARADAAGSGRTSE